MGEFVVWPQWFAGLTEVFNDVQAPSLRQVWLDRIRLLVFARMHEAGQSEFIGSY